MEIKIEPTEIKKEEQLVLKVFSHTHNNEFSFNIIKVLSDNNSSKTYLVE